jgi:hypothetical protein
MLFKVTKMVAMDEVFYVEADCRENAVDLACYTNLPPHATAQKQTLETLCDVITDDDIPDNMDIYQPDN